MAALASLRRNIFMEQFGVKDMTEKTFYDYYPSPVDDLLLIYRNEKLTGIYFKRKPKSAPIVQPDWIQDSSKFNITKKCLDHYFKTGSNAKLPEFELHGTPFQKRVWRELLNIKPGETVTYADIAKKVNSPKASRAVGGAVGKNPISILIPCHRVVGVNGLTGFGGGLDRKEWLLNHEEETCKLVKV